MKECGFDIMKNRVSENTFKGVPVGIEKSDIKKCLHTHKEMIEKKLEIEMFRFSEFGVSFCLAVFYSEAPGCFEEMAAEIRKTDFFFELNGNFSCIVFAHADLETAFKACEKMLLPFEHRCPNSRLYAGVTSVESDYTDQDMVTRAFSALEFARQCRYSNVEDDSVISSVASTRRLF